MAKRVVIFSDTHCGSVFGMLPPDFLDSHEHEIDQNPGQKYLWDCWLDFTAKVKKFKPDIIVANGDLVDGKQRKQDAEELILNLPLDQEEAAVQTCRILRNAAPNAKWFFIAGCVTPGHKVLTSDLRWVPVESLQIGDELLAPSEMPESAVTGRRLSSRRWKLSKVTEIRSVKKICYEVGLSDGTALVATEDHPWLGKRTEKYTNWSWLRTDSLAEGMILPRFMPVWQQQNTYDMGYLSGFFDGEGTLCQAQPKDSWGRRMLIEAGQNPGVVLSRVQDILRRNNFNFSMYPPRRQDTCETIHILGGVPETLRFLGSVRPERLLEKFDPGRALFSATPSGEYKVVYCRKVGVREVVGLSTSTGTYLVEGFGSHNTEYHDGRTAHSLENIASRMEAQKYPGVGSGRLCREVLDVDIEGVVLNVAHHIGGGSGIYRATALDRESVWSALAAEEKKANKAHILVRSHVHFFEHVEDISKHAFNCPCWELQTRFMRKRSVYRMIPDIGGLFLTIDGEAYKRREDPCKYEKVLYRLPEIKPHRLSL